MTTSERQPDDALPSALSIAQLHAQYSRYCLAVAVRVTRDHHLAEDAVQEAFLAHACNPERFDGERSSMASWLATLTHRRAVDLVRHEQSRARATGDVERLLSDRPAAEIGSEEQAFADLIGLYGHTRMAGLSPHQRHLLFLTFYLGYTNEQVAALTGMPLGTVKSRIKAALTALRSSLGPSFGTA